MSDLRDFDIMNMEIEEIKRNFDIMNMEIEEIKRNFDDYSWTFYGVAGWGKSQLCGKLYDDPAFWLWEQGANAIRTKKVPVADWKMAKKHLKTLQKAYAEGKPMPFKTAIMDTVDVAWKRCTKFVCADNGWDDPADAEWGKGHNKVKEEWDFFMSDLESLGIKVVFISHDKDKEKKPKKGDKYDITEPAVAVGCQETIVDKVDFVVYCNIEKEIDGDGNETSIRRMYFRNKGDFRAKSRLLYMPEYIDFADSTEETARLIRKSFDKAIIDEFGEEGGEPPKKEAPKKPAKSDKKPAKSDKKAEKPEKTEEKAEKPKAEEKVTPVKTEEKNEETSTPAPEPKGAREYEEMSLADIKELLNTEFMKLYKSGEKTPVELVALVEENAGVKKISEITDIARAVKLMLVLKG